MKTFSKIAGLFAMFIPMILLAGVMLAFAEAAAAVVVIAAVLYLLSSRFPMLRNQHGTITINPFETRTMLAAIEQMKLARTFLLDTFFGNVEPSTTENVDIDIYKGKRRLAPFVSPLMQGKIVDRIGYTTNTFKPPYIKPKMVTTAADMLKRQAGEIIYAGGMTPAQRAAQQVGKDILELIEMIKRREEWMASQILTTGKVRCTGDGIDVQIDFLLAGDHKITLAGGDKWDVPATATPIKNLRDWRKKVGQDSGLTVRRAVFGSDAIGLFLLCDEVTKNGALSQVKIDRGQISPQDLGDGVVYWGYLKDPGIDIYTYDEWYIDPADGVEKPMVPVGAVIMLADNARTARHYGAIRDLKALQGATAAVPYFPKSWEEEDPSARYIMVQSAPLPALHQPDALLVATVK